MSSDMPLPTPRLVISSASHMMTAVPAVRVSTMNRISHGESLTSTDSVPPNSAPVLARLISAVDCSTASPMVR